MASTEISTTKKGSIKNKEKTIIQEFEAQVKDIRQQFNEQLRCLESRTDVEVALLSEIQDYFKRRAEVELEYSKNLEKLAKQISTKHKAEKQKRESWSLFSLYSWWQQLINETKSEARYRSVVADVYTHHVCPKMASQAEQLQRISKRCREIGSAAHQEILRVLGELHTAMKTYQLCYAAGCVAETKFRTIETQKLRFEESFPKKLGNRKHRFLERDYEKKQAKYLEFKLKALKARNEYLLCIDAANAALHKYFADDLSDLIDCMDVGMEQWLRSLVSTILDSRRTVQEMEQRHMDSARSWTHDVDARSDKRRFLESNHSTFMLPRKFEFRPHNGDDSRHVNASRPVQEELAQRYGQLQRRLRELKTENEEIWKTYATAERKLMEIQRQPELKIQELFNPSPSPPPHSAAAASASSSSNVAGGGGMGTNASVTGTISTIASTATGVVAKDDPSTPRKNSCRETEAAQQKRKMDLCEMEEYLLQKFNQYLLTCNLIHRLEARHDAIQSSLGIPAPPGQHQSSSASSSANNSNGHEHYSYGGGVIRDDSWHSLASSAITNEHGELVSSHHHHSRPPSVAPKPRKKRIGQSTSGGNHRPRLFGGSLEEYVEATGEEIPLVIRSCVRYLSLFGLHHQGVFRVSGSQIEINSFKDSFERGEDSLADVTDASDVNSVAGVLKLYFRELREPLFPIFMFDQFIDCTRGETKPEVVQKIKDLVRTLPRPVYIVMRYLFAFLNHLSEFSDENMMDPYNLAICFGPTLVPIPESRDQVFFHNHVNELVKNMIVFHDEIFPPNDPITTGGIVYEKYLLTDSATGDMTNDEDEGADDDLLLGDGRGALSCSQEDLTAPKSAAGIGRNNLDSPAGVAESMGTTDRPMENLIRTHSDLNLSGHVSLKADDADQSPMMTDADAAAYQQAVWLRRAESGRTKINGGSNGHHHQRKDEHVSELGSIQKGHQPQQQQLVMMTDSLRRGKSANAPRSKRMASCDRAGDPERITTTIATSSDVSSGPSSCSNSPRDNNNGGGGLYSSPNSAGAVPPTVGFVFKVPPPSYNNGSGSAAGGGGGIRSYHTSSSSPLSERPLTAAAISSSAAYMRHGVGSTTTTGGDSPKANRRDGGIGGSSIKRLSLSSYGIPTNTAESPQHQFDPPPLPPTLPEEFCYQYTDSELIRPDYLHHQQQQHQQVPKGLSPSSLKEIQVELKAVLNSLETFTMQHQQTRVNGGKDAPFILSSPEVALVSSPTTMVASTSSPVSPPDLVQNLPSPTGDVPSPSPTMSAASMTTTMSSNAMVQSATTTSLVSTTSSSSLSTAAERFAENKENTLKKGGLPLGPSLVHQPQLGRHATPTSTDVSSSNVVAASNGSKPKPPVPKKPTNAQMASGYYRSTSINGGGGTSPRTGYHRRSTDDFGDDSDL